VTIVTHILTSIICHACFSTSFVEWTQKCPLIAADIIWFHFIQSIQTIEAADGVDHIMDHSCTQLAPASHQVTKCQSTYRQTKSVRFSADNFFFRPTCGPANVFCRWTCWPTLSVPAPADTRLPTGRDDLSADYIFASQHNNKLGYRWQTAWQYAMPWLIS